MTFGRSILRVMMSPGQTERPPTNSSFFSRRSGSSRVSVVSILSLLLATAAGLCCRSGDTAGSSAYRNADLSVRYVGAGTCRRCHAAIAETYAATGMGRAFYPLDDDRVVEDFTSNNRIEIPTEGIRYRMIEKEGRRFIRQEVLADDGTTFASAEKEILYVVGSGNHSRSYLTGHDGWLYQAPVCWYPDRPGWDLCPGYEFKNRHFTREADVSCLFCHNGRMTSVAGTIHRYADPIPHGIDCERCHGPGEIHLALWENPPDPIPDRDVTIVNPAKLPRETRMHVCMQCHLGDADASERVHRPGRDLRDFRPGGRITDFLDVMTFDPPSENRFGLGGQADRLMASRCYRESGGRIDCLTCHDPHVTVYANTPDRRARFRAACLGCHEPEACSTPEADRRRADPSDDCAACHMRRSEPADQRFTAFTDHWIRRRIDPPGPPPSEHASLRLVPIFPREHARLGEAEASLNLGRGYAQKKATGAEGARISWAQPVNLLRKAVAADPSLAEGWFLLGKAALARSDPSEAVGDFRETLRVEPSHRSARMNMAAALLASWRASEAAAVLNEVLRERPDDFEALSDLSRALVEMGREDEAAATLARALAIMPDSPTILANAGMLSARRGRHEEAVKPLRDAAGLDPSVPEIWDALGSSLLSLGRAGEAVAAASRVVSLRPSHPGARLLLGRALAAAGRRDEAAASLREALRLDPAFANAADALREVERGAGTSP